MDNHLFSLAEKLNDIAEELRQMRCDIQENKHRRTGTLFDKIKKCAYDKDTNIKITDEDCETFVKLVENWLPKELSYEDPYPESEVDGYNLALRYIRQNLR
jgi:hypothetical protein